MNVERLQALREAKGLTRAEVAELCGVSENSVYYWERGYVRPRNKFHGILAQAYGVSVDELRSLVRPRSHWRYPYLGEPASVGGQV